MRGSATWHPISLLKPAFETVFVIFIIASRSALPRLATIGCLSSLFLHRHGEEVVMTQLRSVFPPGFASDHCLSLCKFQRRATPRSSLERISLGAFLKNPPAPPSTQRPRNAEFGHGERKTDKSRRLDKDAFGFAFYGAVRDCSA